MGYREAAVKLLQKQSVFGAAFEEEVGVEACTEQVESPTAAYERRVFASSGPQVKGTSLAAFLLAAFLFKAVGLTVLATVSLYVAGVSELDTTRCQSQAREQKFSGG